MYCEQCGTKKEENAQFCQNCGKATSGESAKFSSVNADVNKNSDKPKAIIKCGNCEYIGPGEPARSTWAIILAWLCVVFAPLITIIYFVATHKYRCPKCKSTFLGIKNKEGVFEAKKGTGALGIFLIVLVGIAIIGILASVVLASLNSARAKGQDASIKANLSSIRAQAEIYWDSKSTNGRDGFYLGICSDSEINRLLALTPKVKETSPICNDGILSYAVSTLLNSEKYFCVDSTGVASEFNTGLSLNQYKCPSY